MKSHFNEKPLYHKYYTRLEMLGKDKESSLFCSEHEQQRKKFYSVGGHLGYDEGDEQDEDHLGVH
jgi:hypothetical protein